MPKSPRRPRPPAANDNDPVVDSTTLRRIGYLARPGVLQLTFNNGRVYEYFDVPPRVHAGLMQANSKGGYFNRHIRPRFSYRRVR